MPSILSIKEFEDSPEKAVLSELLRLVARLKDAQIDYVLCGGWVPFLKELAQRSETHHSMSLDIDVLLPASSRTPEQVDKVKLLLCDELSYRPDTSARFRYEKDVAQHRVEVELLADMPRSKDQDGVTSIPGQQFRLEVVVLDGGAEARGHTETITLAYSGEDDTEQEIEIVIPDAVGFLILKTAVTRFREKPKDPYDIYYYIRFAEGPESVQKLLAESVNQPGVKECIYRLSLMFTYPDSKWVEMVLDHLRVTGAERDRQAQLIVRTIMSAVPGI